MANTAAVTIHVQFSKDGSTRSGLSVSVGGKSGSTDSRGNVTFTDLRAGHTYTASHKNFSTDFRAGTGTVVLEIK